MPVLAYDGGQAPLLQAPPVQPISSSIAFASLTLPLLSTPTPFAALPRTSLPSIISSAARLEQELPNGLFFAEDGTRTISLDIDLHNCNTSRNRPTMGINRRLYTTGSSVLASLFTLFQLYQHALFEKITPLSERLDESDWVATSRSWVDRRACDWFGICDFSYLRQSSWTKNRQFPSQEYGQTKAPVDRENYWTSGSDDPSRWSDDERRLREIPQYVLDFAPLIHLYSGENYWPCDISDHLIHTTPHLNYTPLKATSDHPNLTTLDDLNQWGPFVFLQSDDNVEEHPDWLGGEQNIPASPEESDNEDGGSKELHHAGQTIPLEHEAYNDENEPWYEAGMGSTFNLGGERPDPNYGEIDTPQNTAEGDSHVEWRIHKPRVPAGKHRKGGRSGAPAVLVVLDKGNGVLDAFWFFFYSFNLGNTVFNVRAGNHIGDWEHTLVRFYKGEPQAVFFSEHNFGEAYAYHALEKIGKRPIGYSATGTHAMYATPGEHPYVLPYGILKDVTDRGPLWDPLLNAHSFTYDYINDTIRSSNLTPKAPTGWFDYIGHWGDKFYPLSDPRQYRIFGQYHYVNGPLGPRFKNLGRKKICQGNGECNIKHWIGGTTQEARRWDGPGEGETMSQEDMQRLFPHGLPQL